MKNTGEKLYCIVFLAVIFGLGITSLVLPKQTFSENENRMLATLPAFQWESFLSADYMEGLEEFVIDHLAGRDFFVSLKAQMEKATGKKENNGVYFGKDDSFILIPEKMEENILDMNIQVLQNMEQQEMQVRAVLIPGVGETFPENLPNFTTAGEESDIIKKMEKEWGEEKLCYPIVAFRQSEEPVFYKTDHHYTTYGAFLTYQVLQETMGEEGYPLDFWNRQVVSQEFLGTTWSKAPLFTTQKETIEKFSSPQAEEAVVWIGEEQRTMFAPEQLETKDKYAYFLGGNSPVLTIETTAQTGKSAVVFKDSFANALLPMLAAHYETILVFDLRYYNRNPLELIEEVNPQDCFFIYNASDFGKDKNIAKLLAFFK